MIKDIAKIMYEEVVEETDLDIVVEDVDLDESVDGQNEEKVAEESIDEAKVELDGEKEAEKNKKCDLIETSYETET
jgi:hypothetical protein